MSHIPFFVIPENSFETKKIFFELKNLWQWSWCCILLLPAHILICYKQSTLLDTMQILYWSDDCMDFNYGALMFKFHCNCLDIDSIINLLGIVANMLPLFVTISGQHSVFATPVTEFVIWVLCRLCHCGSHSSCNLVGTWFKWIKYVLLGKTLWLYTNNHGLVPRGAYMSPCWKGGMGGLISNPLRVTKSLAWEKKWVICRQHVVTCCLLLSLPSFN